MRTQEEFREYIQTHERLECAVTVIFEPMLRSATGKTVEALDRFVQRHGYTAQGTRWHCLSRGEAISHLQDMLQASLAYREFMFGEAEAFELAQEFAGFFQEASGCWFTNGTRGTWNSITASTFDNALVAMDGSKIGLILFEDED